LLPGCWCAAGCTRILNTLFRVRSRVCYHNRVPQRPAIALRGGAHADAPSLDLVYKLAEYAVFDSDALTVDFGNTPYDERRTEARAAADGYRITRWRDRLYDVQRRLTGT